MGRENGEGRVCVIRFWGEKKRARTKEGQISPPPPLLCGGLRAKGGYGELRFPTTRFPSLLPFWLGFACSAVTTGEFISPPASSLRRLSSPHRDGGKDKQPQRRGFFPAHMFVRQKPAPPPRFSPSLARIRFCCVCVCAVLCTRGREEEGAREGDPFLLSPLLPPAYPIPRIYPSSSSSQHTSLPFSLSLPPPYSCIIQCWAWHMGARVGRSGLVGGEGEGMVFYGIASGAPLSSSPLLLPSPSLPRLLSW